MGVYLQEEVEDVIRDLNFVLDKYSELLTSALSEIDSAQSDLDSNSAFSLLNSANAKIKKVELMTVIDTLEGILEDR
jgi:hypothetical protein